MTRGYPPVPASLCWASGCQLGNQVFAGGLFWRAGNGYVLHELAAAFGLAFAFDLADAAGGHGAGLEADDASVADVNVGAEPVGAEHTSGGVEGHGGGDGTFEFVAGTGEDAASYIFGPSGTADQGIVEAAALEGRGMRELAQLQKLEKHGCLGQIGDDDPGFGGRYALDFEVKIGGPFTLEFFAGERKAFVGGFDVAQRGAREDDAEERSHESRDDGNVADQRREWDTKRVEKIHL